MIPYAGVRIFGGHPTKDRVGEYARKAREMHGRAGKKFERYADLKVSRLCTGILKILDAEKMAEAMAKELGIAGREKVSEFLIRVLEKEGKFEDALGKVVRREITKARALAMIFAIWRTTCEGAEIERARKTGEGGGLPNPPREGGVVFQDARGWYGGRECGGPRYPAMTGTSAVHLFNATQVRRPQEE